MKRKIRLLLCIFMASLCFAGCSSAKGNVAADTATMEEVAEVIIMNFSAMSDMEFAQLGSLSDYRLNYTLQMQTGLPIAAEDFRAMMNSWQSAIEECGQYISNEGYKTTVKESEIVLSTEAKFAKREATIEFRFDKNSNLESMDVSAKITLGEILKKAALNTVLGMGVVFSVLIFLAFLISLIKYIPEILGMVKSARKQKEAPQTAQQPAIEENRAETIETGNDLELVAVITAAIAAQEGTQTDSFVVRSIRRRPSNHWN